jgi:hypothetical protein
MKKLSKGAHNSEICKVLCRVSGCKIEILAKNYRQHLVDKHPQENSSDLSPHGQTRISFSDTQKQTLKRPIDEEVLSDISSKQSKTSNTFPDNACKDKEFKDIDLQAAPSVIFDGENSSLQSGISLNASSTSMSSSFGDSLNKIAQDICIIKQNVEKIVESTEKNQNTCNTKLETNHGMSMNEDIETLIAKVTLARSVKEIESAGFTFDEEKEELSCSVCSTVDTNNDDNSSNLQTTGIFKYEKQTGMIFAPEENLPDKFRNLKKHVKRHVKQSTAHIENLQSQIKKQKEAEGKKTKNYEAGMNLGLICYKLYVKGRLFTDYEEDVLILKQAKANVGNLNHSRKFPPAFLPHVTKEIQSRMKQFITSKLQQTGHKPPLALSADKATYKHRSRQFLAGVTIAPGSDNFLEVVSFGQPIVKHGSTASALSGNMKEGFDALGVEGCQIESTVFDGVYFHIGIQKHFDAMYGLHEGDVLYSYDTLHKSGLVDTHLCKKQEFKWVVLNTDICQKLFRMFNWGSNYEKLVLATALWKLHLTSLVGFSETRFANSRRQVYINIHNEFPAIITCLEDQIMKAVKNPDAKTREKGNQARELKGKISNVHFLLNLSGLADAYGQFGAVVNVAQMVHLLPHERYEMFMEAVGELDKMAKCLSDHCKCDSLVIPGKKMRCLWPMNHKDKKTLAKENEIQGILIIQSHGIHAAGLQTQTRRENEQNQINKGIDAEKTSNKQLQLLINELHTGLKTEVYDEQSVRIITLTKTIVDLTCINQVEVT